MPKRIRTSFRESVSVEVEVESQDVANALAGMGQALAASTAKIELGHVHRTSVKCKQIAMVNSPAIESVRVEAPRINQKVPVRIAQEQ